MFRDCCEIMMQFVTRVALGSEYMVHFPKVSCLIFCSFCMVQVHLHRLYMVVLILGNNNYM